MAHGTSQEGFDAEWRDVDLLTVEGDLVNRCEFSTRPTSTPRSRGSNNSAARRRSWKTRQAKRISAFKRASRPATGTRMARSWPTTFPRRSPAGGGRGTPTWPRCREVAEFPALAEIGVKRITSTVIATRGGRLVLSRSRASGRDQRPDAFRTDVLNIVEIDADEGSRRSSPSTPTTSTPPSRNSTPATSPAKRPPTRTRGQSSQRPTPRSTGTNFRRPRRIW